MKLIEHLKAANAFRSLKALFDNDAGKIVSERGQQILDAGDSPYCKKCSSCGETGCCKPTMCQGGACCEYPETNLSELKFGWSMNRWFEDEIYHLLSDELKVKYDEKWDVEYDLWHK